MLSFPGNVIIIFTFKYNGFQLYTFIPPMAMCGYCVCVYTNFSSQPTHVKKNF